MTSRPVRVYRLTVTYPPGATEPGWEPLQWSPDDWNGHEEFTWPTRRNYLTRKAAHERASLLRRWGATVKVDESDPVTFPADQQTDDPDLELPSEIPGQLDITDGELCVDCLEAEDPTEPCIITTCPRYKQQNPS